MLNGNDYSLEDPAECDLSLAEIQNEISKLSIQIHQGKSVNEKRLDFLIKAQESNPEYQEIVAQERANWRDSVEEFTLQCLERTRSFVPVNVSHSSVADLVELGLSEELAKRIFQRQCLWLTRMSKKEISRLHESDLLGRFNSLQQHLDIIETAAIYAAIPEEYQFDDKGTKLEWRNSIEENLRQMLIDNDEDKLPPSKIRNPCYEGLQFGPVEDVTSVRENKVTKGETFGEKAKPRRSFVELCKEHSLVNKLRDSSSEDSVSENSDSDYGSEEQEEVAEYEYEEDSDENSENVIVLSRGRSAENVEEEEEESSEEDLEVDNGVEVDDNGVEVLEGEEYSSSEASVVQEEEEVEFVDGFAYTQEDFGGDYQEDEEGFYDQEAEAEEILKAMTLRK